MWAGEVHHTLQMFGDNGSLDFHAMHGESSMTPSSETAAFDGGRRNSFSREQFPGVAAMLCTFNA